MKEIQLNPENTNLNLKTGDRLSYRFLEHVSVGYWAEFEIEDESVVKHIGSNTIYNTPERMEEPGITGADEAETTFYFEAISEGTTLLIIRNLFRMTPESEYRFRINVSK